MSNLNKMAEKRETDNKTTKVSSSQQSNVQVDITPFIRTASMSSMLTKKPLMSEEDPADIRPPNTGWSTHLEFFFTLLSFAVGLGNVWRFPYMCYKNGGGAFLFPYIIMLVIVGMPAFFLEIAFGQFASLGPLTIWTVNPLFKGLGYGMITVAAVIGVYYNSIIAQCTLFFFMSMQADLPWDSCENDWNTPNCIDPALEIDLIPDQIITPLPAAHNRTPPSHPRTNYSNSGVISLVGTKTEEFYFNFVLNQSPGGITDIGVPHWPLALCLLFSWILVALALIKGTSSLGKISYFTALFPYAMLTILLIRGVTLPGAGDGILYYLTPDFDKLKNLSVWQSAAIQIFYNISTGAGGVIVMASFNKFNNNIYRDAILIPIANVLTSVFAGLVVFSVLGFIAHIKNTTVDQVASGGPGLIFVVYPEALAQLPVAPLWAVLFFLMMMTLGLGSELSFVETILTSFLDDTHGIFNKSKYQNIAYRVCVCAIFFLLGLPLVCRGGVYVLQILDSFVPLLSLLVINFLEIIVLVWIYGFPNFAFAEDVEMMLGRPMPLYFRYMLRYVTPTALLVLIIACCALYSDPVMGIGDAAIPYPSWVINIGWFLAIIPIIPIPAWMIYYHCYLGGYDSLREYIKPMVNWGPREPQFRFGRYANQTKAIAAMQAIRSCQNLQTLATSTPHSESTPDVKSFPGDLASNLAADF